MDRALLAYRARYSSFDIIVEWDKKNKWQLHALSHMGARDQEISANILIADLQICLHRSGHYAAGEPMPADIIVRHAHGNLESSVLPEDCIPGLHLLAISRGDATETFAGSRVLTNPNIAHFLSTHPFFCHVSHLHNPGPG